MIVILEFKISKLSKSEFTKKNDFENTIFSCHSLKFPEWRPKRQLISTTSKYWNEDNVFKIYLKFFQPTCNIFLVGMVVVRVLIGIVIFYVNL